MTLYDVVYKRFEKMIADFDLADLILVNKEEIELDYLIQAITMYHNADCDLTDRDDTVGQFNFDLTDLQIQVLASYMVKVWVQPYLNNQDLLDINFATSEVNKFSPANRLKSLMDLSNHASKQASLMANRQSVKSVLGRLN